MKKLPLIALIVLFLITRLLKISEVPPSLYWDEASIGYNAYSILKTGSDEWGERFPIHFRAFGEYKLPVYIYSLVPFVWLLGVNELAVRLPSVFFSLGSLIFIYLIAVKISKRRLVGLLAGFYFTVSPWIFIFSRTGYEATAGIMFYLLGIYLFLISLSRGFFIIPSLVSLGISFYSYNSFRILVPILLVVVLISYLLSHKASLTKHVPIALASLLVFAIMMLPAIRFIQSGSAAERLGAIAITGVNLRKWEIGRTIVKNYLSHFSKEFLFTKGDIITRSQQPGFGQLIAFDAILLPLGIYFILKKEKKFGVFVLLLLAISFLPASITREVPHALRSMAAVPFISLIFAYGVLFILEKIKLNRKILIAFILLLYLGTFEIYLDNFFNKYTKTTAEDWQYGYKLIFEKYKGQFNKYDNIVITDRYNQPYIFALFYLKYDPEKYRSEVVYNRQPRVETSLVKEFDKFLFTDVYYYDLPKGPSLIFSNPTDRMMELQPKNILYHPDGSIALYVYEYKK